MTELTFTVPGKPRGQGRPRFERGAVHKDRDDATYEAIVANEAVQAARRQGIHIPVHPREGTGFDVTIYAYHVTPKAFTKMKRRQVEEGKRFPTGKPDIDNVIKSIFDALSGKVWVDDSAVTSILAEKHYGDEPRVEVAVAWEDAWQERCN